MFHLYCAPHRWIAAVLSNDEVLTDKCVSSAPFHCASQMERRREARGVNVLVGWRVCVCVGGNGVAFWVGYGWFVENDGASVECCATGTSNVRDGEKRDSYTHRTPRSGLSSCARHRCFQWTSESCVREIVTQAQCVEIEMPQVHKSASLFVCNKCGHRRPLVVLIISHYHLSCTAYQSIYQLSVDAFSFCLL